jgi:hypothetical protein
MLIVVVHVGGVTGGVAAVGAVQLATHASNLATSNQFFQKLHSNIEF